MPCYVRISEYWDKVFREIARSPVRTASTGQKDLDKALDWLCHNSESIFGFGCGNGVLLLKCCLRGTKIHRGIDISEEAIEAAMEIQKLSGKGDFTFYNRWSGKAGGHGRSGL